MQKKFLILALLPFLVGCKNTKEENQFETDKNGRLYSPSWREKENLIVFHSDDPQEDNTTGEDLGCGGADTMDEDRYYDYACWKTKAMERNTSLPIDFSLGVRLDLPEEDEGKTPVLFCELETRNSDGTTKFEDKRRIRTLPPYNYIDYQTVIFTPNGTDDYYQLFNTFVTFSLDFQSLYSSIGDDKDTRMTFYTAILANKGNEYYEKDCSTKRSHWHFKFKDNGAKVEFSPVRYLNIRYW